MSLADVGDILKHDYKNMGTLLNNTASPVAAQMERTTDSIVGDFAVIAMEVGREFGFGARREGQTMPPGRSVPPKNAQVKVKRLYGRYRISAAEIQAMSTNVGSFTTAQKRRIRNLKDTAIRDVSRQTWGDGSGRLATCGTTTNSTTVQLAAATADQALVNLAEGMQVDIGTDVDPQSIATSRRIVSVDFDNARCVIDGAPVTTTAAAFLYRQGSGGEPQTDTQAELTGLGRHVDNDTTDQGLASTVFGWAATVEANGGVLRPGSENILERAVMKSRNRSGGNLDAFVAGDGVFRHLVNQLKGRQRIVNMLDLKGGHTAVDYSFGAATNVPLQNDRDMTPAFPNSVAGLDYSTFKTYIGTDWKWEDSDGTVLRLAHDDTHEFEAIYYTFRELGVENRNKNLRVDDIETA